MQHLIDDFIWDCLHAEWGDRSQIATVSLAAVYNPVGVTIGAVIGHMLCTGQLLLGVSYWQCVSRNGLLQWRVGCYF